MVIVLQAQTSSNPKRHMPIGNPEMEPHHPGNFKGAMFYLLPLADPVKWKSL